MKHAAPLALLALLGLVRLPAAPAQEAPEATGAKHVWVAHFQPAEDRSDALLEEVIAANRLSDGAPGLIEYTVFRPQDEPGPITVVMIWESRAALDEYRAKRRKEHPGERVFTPGYVRDSVVLDADLEAAWRRPVPSEAKD